MTLACLTCSSHQFSSSCFQHKIRSLLQQQRKLYSTFLLDWTVMTQDDLRWPKNQLNWTQNSWNISLDLSTRGNSVMQFYRYIDWHTVCVTHHSDSNLTLSCLFAGGICKPALHISVFANCKSVFVVEEVLTFGLQPTLLLSFLRRLGVSLHNLTVLDRLQNATLPDVKYYWSVSAVQQVVWGWWPDWLPRHVSTELEPPKLRGRLANDNGTDVWCHTCVNAYMSLTRGPWAIYIQPVNEARTKAAAVRMTFPGAFGLNRTKFKISQLVTRYLSQLTHLPHWSTHCIHCIHTLFMLKTLCTHCKCTQRDAHIIGHDNWRNTSVGSIMHCKQDKVMAETRHM